MNPYSPNIKAIAVTAIIIGIILLFFIERRRYNRTLGITYRTHPMSFLMAFVAGMMEWLGIWLYRLLILFGLFFLLVDWYNSG